MIALRGTLLYRARPEPGSKTRGTKERAGVGRPISRVQRRGNRIVFARRGDRFEGIRLTAPLSARPLLSTSLAGTHPSDSRGRRGQSILNRLLAAERRRGSGGRSGGGSGGSRGGSRKKKTGLLTDAEVAKIEKEFEDGITAAQVVTIFSERGLRFSEATFRKYVQKELLPRSRRVGRKGKHRGSLGVYPAKTIRRVNSIKRLMGEGYTIEEIQDQFLRYTDLIEGLEEQAADVVAQFRVDLASNAARFDTKAKKSLTKEIAEAKKSADDLLRRVTEISARLQGPHEEDLGPAGAAGSAEDLL